MFGYYRSVKAEAHSQPVQQKIPLLEVLLLKAQRLKVSLFFLEMLEGAKSMGAGAATIASAGAAVGIGNVFSSLIHSVARNPSLAKQLFGYAILGFALTEAIASFAPMMAFLISSVFRSKVEVQFHKASLVSLSRAEAFTRRIKKTSVNPRVGGQIPSS